MITLIVEAAVRSFALTGVVWLGIAAFRVNSPQIEKMIWTTVLAGAMAMPALLHWNLAPTLPVTSFALPSIGIQGIHIDVPHHGRALIAIVYVTVSLALLIRFTVGVCRIWRIQHRALPVRQAWAHGADVRVASRLSSPATFGSTILLPACHTSWADSKRAVILAHERAHVRHRDSQIQWLAAVHACVFWFSPLAWWLRRHLAELAEHASDDVVLERNADRAGYATVLLEMAQERSTKWIAVSMANGCVAKRIERILSEERSGRTPARWHRLLAIASVIPVIALAADATAIDPSNVQSVPGETLFGMNTAYPHIVSSPPLEELKKFYPPAAARDGIDGDVQITVTLDEAGRATDTLVLSETPAAMGFGAAASELAHVFKYSNATGRSASVTYRIKFAMDRSDPSQSAKSDTAESSPAP
ncbi:MAG TPA: M56 family metallopeptidase [Steroidobacteraceae bacterium]|nr:M56 family metallopeptidase [Steroidobacteraceae bacterium]